MIAGRRVWYRASLIAPSTASVPELVRNTRFLLAPRAHHFVVEVGAADVQEAVGGVLDGRHHLRMAVARRGDGDSPDEVEESVAVYVFHHDAARSRHHQGILFEVRARRPQALASYDVLGPRPWGRDPDQRIVSHLSRPPP